MIWCGLQAPCEAEAQCAALQKSGKVFAVGTEDMDALTFGTKVLLRHLTFSEARKMPIKEFYLERVLEALEFNMDEVGFVCSLSNCVLFIFNYLNFLPLTSSSTCASSSAATTATQSVG